MTDPKPTPPPMFRPSANPRIPKAGDFFLSPTNGNELSSVVRYAMQDHHYDTRIILELADAPVAEPSQTGKDPGWVDHVTFGKPAEPSEPIFEHRKCEDCERIIIGHGKCYFCALSRAEAWIATQADTIRHLEAKLDKRCDWQALTDLKDSLAAKFRTAEVERERDELLKIIESASPDESNVLFDLDRQMSGIEKSDGPCWSLWIRAKKSDFDTFAELWAAYRAAAKDAEKGEKQ